MEEDLEDKIEEAVEYYWSKLSDQAEEQRQSDNTTRGRRAEVLGGGQMDGFEALIEEILIHAGVPEESILHDHDTTLPGYYRATKRWDLAVIHNGKVLAIIEFKSISSSFGNNLNNRVEEALGNSLDVYDAYKAGAYEPSPNPWMGYFLVMAENDSSKGSVSIREPNFEVFEEYKEASYMDRAEQLCLRMLRNRLYDGTAFLTSDEEDGLDGDYREPKEELKVRRFISSLVGHVTAHLEYEDELQETLEQFPQ